MSHGTTPKRVAPDAHRMRAMRPGARGWWTKPTSLLCVNETEWLNGYWKPVQEVGVFRNHPDFAHYATRTWKAGFGEIGFLGRL